MRAVIYSVVLLTVSAFVIFAGTRYRSRVEQGMIPLIERIRGQSTRTVIVRDEDTVARLQEQNEALRKQLGAIPERSQLGVARVVWDSGSHITISYYGEVKLKKGTPVISESMFIGTIIRTGEHMAVVKRPFDSRFSAKAKTKEVQGTIQGTYDQKVQFLFPSDKTVKQGDVVWIVDDTEGWQFRVGTVERVDQDKSKPQQRAWVQIPPGLPETVFVAR